MAEPARRLDDDSGKIYDEPTGSAPSDPRPRLKALEGGGDTSEPKRGHLAEAGSSPEDLANKEAQATKSPLHENQVGKGYSGPGSSLSRFSSINKFKRRKALLGGGLLGTIVAIFMFFTFLGGPFEFIHIAQLLEKFHFAGLQSQQDDRFAKEVRLFRFASKGEVEKTRLSFLGNKFADRFETRLNSTGLESSYTKTFGLFDGYVIDPANEKFKNMSTDDIKQYVKENFGVDTVDGSTIKGGAPDIKGKLVIDASSLGYLDNYKMTYGLLRESGYSKLSSAIGARYLCARAACTSMLHPLTKKVGVGKRAIEEWWNNRNTADENGGTSPVEGVEEETTKDSTKPTAGQDSLKGEIESNLSGSKSAKDISASLGKGGLAAAGILCIAKGMAKDAHNVKAGQIQVLMRMAVESMAMGSQLESGQDVNMGELAQYNTLLSGTDSTGNNTSWDSSESIQANLGNSKTGVAPSKTLTTVTNDATPFDFLNSGSIGTVLGGICSAPGQIIQVLFGSVTDLTVGLVGSVILSQSGIIGDLTNWLAGKSINVDAVGADFGNEIDYGAALAANSQAMLVGGAPLSSSQTADLRTATDTVAQEQFDHQSLLHKVFSPYDSQSMVAKVIDSSSRSPMQNIGKISSMLLNVKGAFSSVASLFSGQAHAASTGFDYGFPVYGFSQADMTNPAYANPYQNACLVVGCPQHTNPSTGAKQPIAGFLTDSTGKISAAGQEYINEASKCFGASISPDPTGNNWDVVSDTKPLPNPYDSSYPKDCGNSSDKNWTRLRFFIMDTETMNNMSCYEGDNTACTDVGFNGSAAAPDQSAATPTSPGTYQNPLRDVKNLKAGRVDQGVDYSGSGPIYAIGNGKLINITNSGWAVDGGPPTFMVYQLSDGPAQGKFVYVAERCIQNPSLSIGSIVNSTTSLCTLVDASPNLEIGWGEPCSPGSCGNALAKNVWGTDVDNTAHYTAYGRNFSDLLQSVGAPPGTINSGADLLGSLSAGWPTW